MTCITAVHVTCQFWYQNKHQDGRNAEKWCTTIHLGVQKGKLVNGTD